MTKDYSEEINDWIDALDNLILFNGREDASELIHNILLNTQIIRVY